MEIKSLNPINVFFSANISYKISMDNLIQRKYEWGEDMACDLISSYKDSIKDDITPFIGGLLYYKDDEKKTIYIYDGQQRVTTIYLFTLAYYIRKKIKTLANSEEELRKIYNDLNISNFDEDKDYDICSSYTDITVLTINSHSSERRLLLLPSDDKILKGLYNLVNNQKICKDLIYFILNPNKSNYKKVCDVFDGISMKGITSSCIFKNLRSMYFKFFSKESIKNSVKVLEETLYNLQSNDMICNSAKEGIVQFKRINNDHQPLSAERLCISLLGYNMNKSKEVCELSDNSESFQATLSDMKDKEIRRIIFYFLYYKGIASPESKIDVFLQEYQKENKYDTIGEIYKFYTKYYKKLFNGNLIKDKNDSYIYSAFLSEKMKSNHLLMIDLFTDKFKNELSEVSEKEKINALKLYIWGNISHKILKQSASGISLFSNIVKDYIDSDRKETLSDFIKNHFKNLSIYMDIDSNKFKYFKFTRTNDFLVKSILNCIEKYIIVKNGYDRATCECEVQTEHIHSQKPDFEKYEYDVKDENLTLTLGNLTLLTEEKNKINTNKPFYSKKDMYNKSQHHITKRLINYDKWTDETIKENASYYIENLKKILSL